jgi:hypothetical protein
MNNPIVAAVEPLRQEAIEDARAYAIRVIESITKQLEAAGGDVKVLAPHPHGNMSRPEYMKAKAKLTLVAHLTREVEKRTYSFADRTKPVIVKMDAEGCARFIRDAEEGASAQYTAYVAKLVGKIGEVTAATLVGDRVWARSVMQVTLADGTTERWLTQRIVNVSPLGTVFNQWPTRKVK